uniref:Uncharacterized protein n=1 Tax=Lepeophtheirus salmonis TaxID=72036 RepID=A0A0K2TRS9_LEPSM
MLVVTCVWIFLPRDLCGYQVGLCTFNPKFKKITRALPQELSTVFGC